MQTYKERIDIVHEGLILRNDTVDVLLMVNGYRLKIVGTYQYFYCSHLTATCNPVFQYYMHL